MQSNTPSVVRSLVRANKSLPTVQRGMGIIEMLIIIFISILILAGGMAWWTSLTTKQTNQAELENVSSLMASVRMLKTASGYGSSGTDLIPVLINGAGVPGSMQKTSSAVYNSWGGAVTATSTGIGYTLTYAAVPAASCVFLASKAASDSTQSLSINGGTAVTGEITAATANTSCNSSSNSLAWSGR